MNDHEKDTQERLRGFVEDVESWQEEAEAPSLDELAAYVDGELDDVDREIVETWLEIDPTFQRVHEELCRQRSELTGWEVTGSELTGIAPGSGLWRLRRWATAAVLAAGVLGAWWWSSGAAEVLRDGPLRVRMTSGDVSGLETLPPDLAADLATAFANGRLPTPAALRDLQGRELVLLSGSDSGAAPDPVAPVGTRVRSARPVFSWLEVDGAEAYSVVLVDAGFREIARSERLTQTRWQPPVPLPRDVVISWQVRAHTPEGDLLAPRPPAPEARFSVLSEAAVATLEHDLSQARGSKLAAAFLAARAGLLDEAQAQLQALTEEAGDSEVVARWLEQLREGASPSP